MKIERPSFLICGVMLDPAGRDPFIRASFRRARSGVATGDELRAFKTGDKIFSFPWVADHVICIASQDGTGYVSERGRSR